MSLPIDSAEDLQSVWNGTWIRSAEFHEQHASTNDHALQIALENHPDLPMLVYTPKQTAGRGRGTKTWWATRGALTFSLLLDPTEFGYAQDRWCTLSLTSALAVGHAILKLTPNANITWKWPNDVLIAGRKVSGILLEVPSSAPPRMVIGIGINVNNTIDQTARHEQQLHQTAVSLADLNQQTIDTRRLLREFLQQFSSLAHQFHKDPEHLPRLWSQRDELNQKKITLQVGDRLIRGRAVGIDPGGALRIDTIDKGIQSYAGGVITERAHSCND